MPLPTFFNAIAAKCPPRSPLQNISTDTSIHITAKGHLMFNAQLLHNTFSAEVIQTTD